MNVFVLSGGNTKGGFQYGAMDELHKINIKPDIIVGNSIGAVNGFIYNYRGLDGMRVLWNMVNKRSDYLRYNWRRLFWDGIFDLTPLESILEEVRKDGLQNIKTISTTVNICTGQVEYIDSDHEHYLEATLGSSAEPVFMRPIMKKWVDGGLREIVPLDYAVNVIRPKRIFCINTMPFVRNPPAEEVKQNMFSLLRRTVDAFTHETSFRDVDQWRHKNHVSVIAPKEVLHDTLVFDNELILRDIEAGRQAVKEMTDELTKSMD